MIFKEDKGHITESLEHSCSDSYCINQKVVKRWLDGGVGFCEPSWDALVEVLCKIGKKVLAEDLIRKLVSHKVDTMLTSCPD